jgi:hypothetical protein
MAMGRIVRGDPTVWKIVEDKLYFNCRQEIRTRKRGQVYTLDKT